MDLSNGLFIVRAGGLLSKTNCVSFSWQERGECDIIGGVLNNRELKYTKIDF